MKKPAKDESNIKYDIKQNDNRAMMVLLAQRRAVHIKHVRVKLRRKGLRTVRTATFMYLSDR